jgi:hypothetical protein
MKATIETMERPHPFANVQDTEMGDVLGRYLVLCRKELALKRELKDVKKEKKAIEKELEKGGSIGQVEWSFDQESK